MPVMHGLEGIQNIRRIENEDQRTGNAIEIIICFSAKSDAEICI